MNCLISDVGVLFSMTQSLVPIITCTCKYYQLLLTHIVNIIVLSNVTIFCIVLLKAIGKYSKAKAKEIHQLLHGGLYINVATEAYETSELRGKISILPYSSHLANYKG